MRIVGGDNSIHYSCSILSCVLISFDNDDYNDYVTTNDEIYKNILRCCEYSFLERLFGNAGRDKDTGTPMHAPFERNRLTMSVFTISTGFQAAWCVVALSVTIPLCLFFSPVVSIPSFVVPFASIFLMQEMLGPLMCRCISFAKQHVRQWLVEKWASPQSDFLLLVQKKAHS